MTSQASSSATTHKIYLIVLRRSKAFHRRQNRFKILQDIKNSGEGFHQTPPPPPPPLYHGEAMNLLVRPRVNNSNKLFHFRTVLFLRILNLREMFKQLKPILKFISLTVLSLSSSGYSPSLSFQLYSFSISFRYARQRPRLRRSIMAIFEDWYVCVLF